VISQKQIPLPDNIKHSQETDIHATAGFEAKIAASERPLGSANTVIYVASIILMNGKQRDTNHVPLLVKYRYIRPLVSSCGVQSQMCLHSFIMDNSIPSFSSSQ